VLCGNVTGVFGSVHSSGPKPGDRSSWPNAKIPVNDGGAGVGNCGAGQNGVASCRSEEYGGLLLGGSRRAKGERRTEKKEAEFLHGPTLHCTLPRDTCNLVGCGVPGDPKSRAGGKFKGLCVHGARKCSSVSTLKKGVHLLYMSNHNAVRDNHILFSMCKSPVRERICSFRHGGLDHRARGIPGSRPGRPCAPSASFAYLSKTCVPPHRRAGLRLAPGDSLTALY